MTQRTYLNYWITLALVGLIAFSLAQLLSLAAASSPTLLSAHGPTRLASWDTHVHVFSNAVFSWKPWVFASTTSSLFEPIVQALVFGLGISACGLLLRKRMRTLDIALSMASVSLLLILFGFDPFVLASVAFIPWIFASLVFLARKPSAVRYAALGVTALLFSGSANQCAFPLVIVLLFALECLIASEQSAEVVRISRGTTLWGATPNARFERHKLCAYALLLLPSLIVFFGAPLPDLPEYPPLAHVVPDDNIPGHINALLGPSTQLPVIDRPSLKSSYAPIALLLFIAVSIILATHWQDSLRRFCVLPFVLSAAAVFDTVPSEHLAQIGPLAALTRVMPGLFLIPMTPLALAAAFFCLLLIALLRRQVLYSSLAAITVILGMFSVDTEDPNSLFGRRTLSKQLKAMASAPDLPPDTRAMLISPSFRLLNELGGRPLAEPDRFHTEDFSALPAGSVLEVSSNAPDAANAFDADENTRWHSGARAQQPGEWITVRLPSAIPLDGIELDTGAWRWDFPRGIAVEYLTQCPAGTDLSSAGFSQAVPEQSWQGRVVVDSGYPAYYGGQDDVRIIFPSTVIAQCLRVSQTASHPVFQWSVAEFRLLRARDFP